MKLFLNHKKEHMETTISIQSKAQIVKVWQEINQLVADAAMAVSPEEWFTPLGENKWSPAGQVEHLFLSANPVSSALKMPQEMLELQFGWFQGTPRSYNSLKYLYKEMLKKTDLSNNPFGPSGNKSREDLLRSWQMVKEKIPNRLENWTEEDLDRYCIPHPIMGPFSVREMLYFTIFHTEHHLLQLQLGR